MNNDSFSPEEQQLIRRLQDAPKPRLAVRTKDAIWWRMTDEMDAPARLGASPLRFFRGPWLVAGMAAALTLVVAAAILFANRPLDGTTITLTARLTSIAAGATVTAATDTPVGASPTATLTPQVPSSPTPTDEPATPTWTSTAAADVSPTLTASMTPSFTPSLSPTLTPTLEMVIAMEGPIQRIDANTITIYGIDVAVAEGNPILDIIDVGDMVRVEGGFDEQIGLVATSVENLLDDEDMATVSLDGPVEAIDGEMVTVNGIDLVLSPDGPSADTLAVGDFLSVRGNIEVRDGLFVLVAVTVDVLDNADIATPTSCYYHEDGMGMGMGHWHCDGMGMGMGVDPGMGMGAPPPAPPPP